MAARGLGWFGAGADAAFDGEKFWLAPVGAGQSARPVGELPAGVGRRLALLPPLVEIRRFGVPKIPALELLAATEDEVLWQQLLPDSQRTGELLGWNRHPGDDGDELVLAMGQRQQIDRLGDAAGRKLLIPLSPDTWWRADCARQAIRPGGPPLLFHAFSSGRRLALRLAACALLLTALTALAAGAWQRWSAPPVASLAPTADELQAQIAARQASNRRLTERIEAVESRRHRLEQLNRQVEAQNRHINALAAAMPRGLNLLRLLVETDKLSLSANGPGEALFARLQANWQMADASLGLESVRRTADGNFVFSAVLKAVAGLEG